MPAQSDTTGAGRRSARGERSAWSGFPRQREPAMGGGGAAGARPLRPAPDRRRAQREGRRAGEDAAAVQGVRRRTDRERQAVVPLDPHRRRGGGHPLGDRPRPDRAREPGRPGHRHHEGVRARVGARAAPAFLGSGAWSGGEGPGGRVRLGAAGRAARGPQEAARFRVPLPLHRGGFRAPRRSRGSLTPEFPFFRRSVGGARYGARDARLRSPASAYPLQPARRRHPTPGSDEVLRRDRDEVGGRHRPRKHVRGGQLLPGGEETRHQAGDRLRGVCRRREGDGRQEPAGGQPPGAACPERRRLPEPQVPQHQGVHRRLLLRPARGQAAAEGAQRGPDRPDRLHGGRRAPRGAARRHGRGAPGSARPQGHLRRRAVSGDPEQRAQGAAARQPRHLRAGARGGSAARRHRRQPLRETRRCEGDEVLMAIASGRTFDDPKRMRHDTEELYIKSPEEMYGALEAVTGVGAEWKEAVHNSWLIAGQCNVNLNLKDKYLPKFQVPAGETLDSFLQKRAREGLDQRFAEIARTGRRIDADGYRERLERELGVIIKMGFSGYFLIVQDFINWAKRNGIPVGPGRGSGAGSLVAYSLRVTDIDPIPYNLLFERFLNPERVSMPDFDIDFCQDRRGEVISYVTEKYGKENV